MKEEVAKVDATPTKRLFSSIIADYDLNRSVCELIDNALDVWSRSKRRGWLRVSISIDSDQKTITIEDNAGGVPFSDLRNIVAPGETSSTATDETIGIFGVGTKRAVVALAQEARITTRFKKDRTYQLDLDDNWIEDPSWDLPVYEVDSIAEGTTRVSLQRLRIRVDDEAIDTLKEHLSTTYGICLRDRCTRISVNGAPIVARFFDDWSYPPNYSPRRYVGTIDTAEGTAIQVEVIAGLASESSPAAGEYGVYFYCNDRLVARGLKTFDVGFAKGLAGLPHPKVALTRVIVNLKGSARSMPWNSSKSDINTKNEVFLSLREWLVQVVKSYASLSRIWMGEWPDKVFKYKHGDIESIPIDNFPTARKSYLPPLPKSRPRFGDVVAQKNKRIAEDSPWTRGLYEGVIAADLISKQRLVQRNRIAFIILDSTLEIAFKEYLVNDSGATYNDTRLQTIFSNRASVHQEIQKYVNIGQTTWKKISHFYRLRCKFVHERATVGIGDTELQEFWDLIEGVLRKLFKLRFT